MKRKFTFLVLLCCCAFMPQGLHAQCSFTPTVTPNNLVLCPNSQDTLWTQAYDSYQWLKDGAPITGATGQYHIVSASVDGGSMFSAIATQGGCTDTSVEVLVDGWAFLPPFVITEGNFGIDPNTSGNALFCAGDSILLILGSPYTESIQWFNNGVPIPGATDDTFVVTQGGAYTVQGAPATCPSYIATLGVSIGVDTFYAPHITPDSVALCPGAQVNLTADPSAGTYQWYKNGTVISGATSQSYMATAAASGTDHYYVTSSLFTCTYRSPDSAKVHAHALATVTISLVGGQLVATPGGSVLSNFEWYRNGTLIAGANDSTYTPTQSGTYTVKAKDKGCDVGSAGFVYTAPNSTGHVSAASISVYPNPVRSRVYIDAPVPVQVSLSNVEGKILLREKNVRSIDLGRLADGLYLLHITDKDGLPITTRKLIKTSL